MNKVIVLFDRDVDDIQLIVKILATMKINVVDGRTKCDNW